MSELSEILPQHDFWRTMVLAGFAVFFLSVVAIVATQASYLLGVGAILGFLAWMHRSHDRSAKADEEASELDAMEVLRARYANGDIDETEFEHRLSTLLETESTNPREKELSFE